MSAAAALPGLGPRRGGRRLAIAGVLLTGAGALGPLALPSLTTNAGIFEAALVAGALVAFLSPLLMLVRSIEELKATRSAAAARRAGRPDWAAAGLLLATGLLAAICTSGFAVLAILAAGSPGLLTRAAGTHLSLVPAALGAPVLASLLVACFLVAVARRPDGGPADLVRRITAHRAFAVAIVFGLVMLEWIVVQKLALTLGLSPQAGAMAAGLAIASTLAPMSTRDARLLRPRRGAGPALAFAAKGRRKHAAVAFADLAGFTALSGRDERAAHYAAALLHNAARAVCESRGLRVVKSMGDAVLLEGPNAYGMAEALLELHAAFPALSRVHGIEPLAVHSGAHVGEVTETPDGDLYGQAVNLASRIQAQAGDGQVACSLEFARAAGLGPERLRWLGVRALKNVERPVTCFTLARSPSR